MAHVEMYTTHTCAFCVRARRLLQQKGVDPDTIVEIDVSYDRVPMIERTMGAMTVPQIFIDGVHVGGYDGLVALDRAGKLDAMLDGTAASD